MSEIYGEHTYIVHDEYSVGQLFHVITLEFSDVLHVRKYEYIGR